MTTTMTAAAPRRLTAEAEPARQRISKPWGWEEIWAETPFYCGKKLFIVAGKRLSLQYHDEKLESQCLVQGRALLLLDDDSGALRSIEMEVGRGYTIAPFRRHRLIALEDATIIEVSTPETGTTFRLEDDFGRPDETDEARAQRERVAIDSGR